MLDISIVCCNFQHPPHRTAFIDLLNIYISDEMGGGIPLSGQQAKDLLDQLQAWPHVLTYLAQHEGQYVGLLNAFLVFATFSAAPAINIHDLIVHPAYRRQGLGRLLMQHIEQVARQKNCARLTLEVRQDNKHAQKLYQSLGYDDAAPAMFFWRKILS